MKTKQKENEVVLCGCYHSGLAYVLGYDANGEVELDSKLFTNFNTGLNGGAVAAQMAHRQQFDPNCDIKRFIVALKPVQILTGIPDGDDYQLENNVWCDLCCINDREEGEKWCEDCLDDCCHDCGDEAGYCDCEDAYEDDCNKYGCYCDTNDNEDFCDMCSKRFNQDETPVSSLNAFARARHLKSKE